eukprot:7429720-Pyramimonas_sp.AAC.1
MHQHSTECVHAMPLPGPAFDAGAAARVGEAGEGDAAAGGPDGAGAGGGKSEPRGDAGGARRRRRPRQGGGGGARGQESRARRQVRHRRQSEQSEQSEEEYPALAGGWAAVQAPRWAAGVWDPAAMMSRCGDARSPNSPYSLNSVRAPLPGGLLGVLLEGLWRPVRVGCGIVRVHGGIFRNIPPPPHC